MAGRPKRRARMARPNFRASGGRGFGSRRTLLSHLMELHEYVVELGLEEPFASPDGRAALGPVVIDLDRAIAHLERGTPL